MKLRLTALALLCAGSACAESFDYVLNTARPLDTRVGGSFPGSEDTLHRDPRSYLHHGASKHAAFKRLTLTNIGQTSLTGQLLMVDEQDWTSLEALRKSLHLPKEPRLLMERLFAFWCDHITHADSDAPGGKEPLALLNFWGYALCGDNTAALTHLATAYGVPARKIPLNGHVAAEYFYDNAWHIHDADQNICYLRLDNRTLASAADLRADPLLARRTKVFGRYAAMDATASAFNTSLHEFIDPREEKPVVTKMPPAPVREVTLFPGEQMIVHGTQAPDQAIGRTDLRRWGAVREEGLRIVEYTLRPKLRQTATAGVAAFAAGYPILHAVNHTTGEIFSVPAGQPTFRVEMKFRSPDDRISVYCQRARATLPALRFRGNTFGLACVESEGEARLVTEFETMPPDVTVPTVTTTLADPTPVFLITPRPEADLLWWQVSTTKDFAFVAPNFDAVIPATGSVAFDPFTASFIDAHQPHFFRVKARHAGVWSEWSTPLEFRVEKPTRPAPSRITVEGAKLRFSWPDAGGGAEYLIFGSNRLDFLPEPFAEEEIVALRDQIIEQRRPNKNLVATVTKPEIELEPTFRFYRVIARRAGVLSVPSDLITTPAVLATKLPPALVLQDRWQRVDGRDAHFATELPLR